MATLKIKDGDGSDKYLLVDGAGSLGDPYVTRHQLVDANGTVMALEPNGNVPIAWQDQHTQALDLYFIQSLGQTTLAVETSEDDNEITLDDATGFVAGNVIGIFGGTGVFYFGQQIGAPVGDVITLDTPMDKVHAIGATVIRANKNMAVNGAVTTQVFQIGPTGGVIEVDVTRLMGYLQSGTAMDDSLFGSLGALTYGIVLRHKNGTTQNIWNAKTNGEMALLCYDFTYTTKAPAGQFGARFRNSYGGQDKHGVTIRLDPGDTLELLVQDDLTGLGVFNMIAQGHIVD